MHNRFSVRVPSGWYSTNPDDEAAFELWLNNSDFSSTITFTQIDLSGEAQIAKNHLYEFLKEFKLSGSKQKGKIESEEKFYIGRNEAFAFEYVLNGNDIRRTILFNYNNTDYECTAMLTGKKQADNKKKNELFSVQNSIIKSISN